MTCHAGGVASLAHWLNHRLSILNWMGLAAVYGLDTILWLLIIK